MVMAKKKEPILAATATIADPSRTTKVTERSRPSLISPDGLVDGDHFSFERVLILNQSLIFAAT
jgi:hypothetical protein